MLALNGSTFLLLPATLLIALQAEPQRIQRPVGAPSPQICETRTPISSIPVTIGSGSYFLTKNLRPDSGAPAVDGITIAGGNVTIDLNGFSLIGLPGSLKGIRIEGPAENVSVFNGTIRNWGGYGIDGSAVTDSVFARLHVASNGCIGIRLGARNVIVECTAIGNGWNCSFSSGLDGIFAGPGSTVIDCTAHNNAEVGISVSHGSTVTESTGSGNGKYGIYGFEGVVIEGCTARDNDADNMSPAHPGIEVRNHSAVRGCVSTNNPVGIQAGDGCIVESCVVSGNQSDGIHFGNDCLVFNNTARANAGAGIDATGGGNRIDNNHSVANGTAGIRTICTSLTCGTGPRNFVTRNSAHSNASDFSLGDGTLGSISTNPATAGPWDNFAYSY